MISSKAKEYAGIDYFRMIAAFLVISIHTSPLAGFGETADFILTRVIARVAVPFFFTASGFFLFRKEESIGRQLSKLLAFIKKTAAIYGTAILIYLPLSIYTGSASEWRNLLNLLKDIVFDGTFYHLWYLPAAIMGACIVRLLLNRLKAGQAFAVGLLLYIIGLFGDSYYGISEKIPFMKAAYNVLFIFFDYTRNGLFFAPVFLLLGALLAGHVKRMPLKAGLSGLAVSAVLMLAEALVLRGFKLQRHDSMYLMLVPCMFFLFQSLLLWRGRSIKALRELSLLIYLIHPAVIVMIRGFAKAVGLQGILIGNRIIYFAAVAAGSLIISAVLVALLNVRRIFRADSDADADRAWAEINMTNLRHNVKILREALPEECEIMAVVKANAYGHGAATISQYLNGAGVKAFAVATIEEGIYLRMKGVKGEILILGYTPAKRAAALLRYRLSQAVADVQHAQELNSFGRPVQVHIKIDTGMNRLGESYRHVSEIASVFNCKNLKVTGIFTHLCVSDSLDESDVDFTNKQIKSFYQLLDQLRLRNIPIPAIHIQSSYGVLNYPYLQCRYARIGIALYGVLSSPAANVGRTLDLRPVLALKSKTALVRTIEPGESVGYGHDFVAGKRMKIAVVSIGYADGLPRSLSTNGYVLIRGKIAPIIGRICMDQFITDVTDIPDTQRGEVVTLIGTDSGKEITAEQVAFRAGTITNELLSRLSDCRLKKVFII